MEILTETGGHGVVQDKAAATLGTVGAHSGRWRSRAFSAVGKRQSSTSCKKELTSDYSISRHCNKSFVTKIRGCCQCCRPVLQVKSSLIIILDVKFVNYARKYKQRSHAHKERMFQRFREQRTILI